MRKNYLLTPGPTSVPSDVLLELAKPIVHHRTPQFAEIFHSVIEGLKYVFQTKNDVLVFASSGTGAMEASVVNLLSPGDKVLTIKGGKFGERWDEICKAYNIETFPIDVEWGKPVNSEDVRNILEKEKDIKAVFATLTETSTAVLHDVKALGSIVKEFPAVLVVDAVSGLGAVDIQTDNWNVDVVVAGSQKALMLPPGLAFASISDKAWDLVKDSKCPKYYWSFAKARKSLETDQTPYTPAVSLIFGLSKSLEMIKEEGLENVLARHSKLANATRAAVKAMGLELLAPESPSDAVTAVKVPQRVDGVDLVKSLKKRYDVMITGGQAQLKGKIIRIAHMGYSDTFDIITVISALEMALKDSGYNLELGKGIKAAEEILK